jgi:hypothetical protein
MNYFFECPYCNQSFEVDAELAGLNCVCTGCGEVFVVPLPPKVIHDGIANRQDDENDLRPEVWVPDEAHSSVSDSQEEEQHGPLAPQYAGDALLGDRVVPVNFVPTGMEPLPEVYGMIPEPGAEPSGHKDLPAEIQIRRVTPMMIENSGDGRATGAPFGILRTHSSVRSAADERTAKPKAEALKYSVIGVAVGFLLAVAGVFLNGKNSSPGSKPDGVPKEASPASGREEASENENAELGKLELENRFPDSFMGIKFGSKIEYIADRVTWAKEGENLHKPTTLADERVQAVLIPDHDGRLTVGAYVRISNQPDSELVPFLEWALTVQDAVTAKFGRPTSVHVVKNAATETEIVRKIREGSDFYECTWEDPFRQCLITLGVSGKNSRLVVFRLEYKSIPLTRSYLNRKMAE